jgi:hypothetical protein
MNALPRPKELVGTVRRFGHTGPVYEVTGVVGGRDDDKANLTVVIPETGEELEVPYVQVVVDPREDD